MYHPQAHLYSLLRVAGVSMYHPQAHLYPLLPGAAQMSSMDTEAFSSVSNYNPEHTIGNLLEAMGTAVRVHLCACVMHGVYERGWLNIRVTIVITSTVTVPLPKDSRKQKVRPT